MKTITDYAKSNKSVALVHLFEFDLYNFDGTFAETLYFTDHDIFVKFNNIGYVPLSITFDSLSEDTTNASSEITVTIENINKQMTSKAFQYEWRNNRATISRLIYVPKEETGADSEVYEFGYGDTLESFYPEVNFDEYPANSVDVYVLFDGYINHFSANESSLQANISTRFIHWKNKFPKKTYDQKEYNAIIDTMVKELYWGRPTT